MAKTNISENYKTNATINFKTLLKPDYLQSFNSMMEKTTPIKFKLKDQKASFFETPKVILPNFEEA